MRWLDERSREKNYGEEGATEAKVAGGVAKVKRSLAARMGRGMAWMVIGFLILVMVVVGGFWWYSTTDDFNGVWAERW